jgi:hypothetical protein
MSSFIHTICTGRNFRKSHRTAKKGITDVNFDGIKFYNLYIFLPITYLQVKRVLSFQTNLHN